MNLERLSAGESTIAIRIALAFRVLKAKLSGGSMNQYEKDQNLDQEVIDGFGHEWAAFDYSENENDEALDKQFLAYCSPINLDKFGVKSSIAADFGAGSGRWTARLLPYFSLIYALEPSDGANQVLRNKFKNESRVRILQESVGANSIPAESLDLAMSLGVLHHIPDTGLAIQDVATRIKSGGVFLCYLYYKLENKPILYRGLFWTSNSLRWVISRMPYAMRRFIAQIIAGIIYFPLARISRLLKDKGKDVSNFPLHHYANMPFVMLRNDALDRFGTRLEQRFSKNEIIEMIGNAGFDLSTLKFSEEEPFWTFAVKKI
jgi:SAM-dependent methyltransferase